MTLPVGGALFIRNQKPFPTDMHHAPTDMLAALPDDVLRRIVRACVRLLEPAWLASIGTTSRYTLEICRPELAKLRERRAAVRALQDKLPSFAYHELLQLEKVAEVKRLHLFG